MSAKDWITSKQLAWAESHHIAMESRERGRSLYTVNLRDNLFQDMNDSTIREFKQGDGNELKHKMKALHSSSALGVNVFDYWKGREVSVIAAACGLCRSGSRAPEKIVFEDKYEINQEFPFPPNIDVVIHNNETSKIKRLAIECKFTEAYGGFGHGGLSSKYLDDCGTIWDDIPNFHAFALTIRDEDTTFKHLHPAQLIKHILGLKSQFKLNEFRLLYLWFDAFGEEGAAHHAEAERFKEVALADGIMFHELTYQELIVRLARNLDAEHSEYVRYLAERYL